MQTRAETGRIELQVSPTGVAMPLRSFVFAILACAAAGCGGDRDPIGAEAARNAPSESAGPAWFVESADQAGLTFVHQSGHDGQKFYLPEIMVGGGAVIDYDGDGWLDVYLVQSGSLTQPRDQQPGNKLYHNQGDGTFRDVTEGSGADDRGYGCGAAVGDFDGDGRPDLYITNVGPNVLLRNNGDGSFTDVTAHTGVGDQGYSKSAAFLDIDNDGDLDLFVVNYVAWTIGEEMRCEGISAGPDYCSPISYNAPAPDTLYRNNGDGTFTDISSEAGLRRAFGNGLGVVCLDYNHDGFVDVFVANDQTPNQLWENQGDGRFLDVAMESGCAIDRNGAATAGMGVHAADLTGAGFEDVLVVNIQAESDSYYQNRGGYFVDETIASGLAEPTRSRTRFGAGLLDFNNDGRFDIYEACGAVFRLTAIQQLTSDAYAESNLLFRGSIGGRFEPVPNAGIVGDPLIMTGRGAIFGDLDNDGGIDILVVNRDAPVHLFHNVAPDRGNWIEFRVLTERGIDAYNAIVTLQSHEGATERTDVRVVRSAYSYLTANDPRVHFGLGAAEQVDRVTIEWMGGEREEFGPFTAGQIITLRRGEGGRVD